MADLALRHVTTAELPAYRALLIDIYLEVYADRLSDPFFSRERFDGRLNGHAARNDWEAVIAYQDDEPIGYAYGAALQPGASWWLYQLDPLPEDYTEETGRRTLALFEIMVREPWRGNGYAERIHEELLSGRKEERVTLLVDPRKEAVKRMYERWGYERIGDQKPFPDSPLFSTMVRQMRGRRTA